jgi:hypothetical protein
MAQTECIVTTSSERPIKDVAKDLAKAGLKVDQVLDEIGSITGTCEPKQLDRLRAVRGVSDVSQSGGVDVGPPGSPTTW